MVPFALPVRSPVLILPQSGLADPAAAAPAAPIVRDYDLFEGMVAACAQPVEFPWSRRTAPPTADPALPASHSARVPVLADPA